MSTDCDVKQKSEPIWVLLTQSGLESQHKQLISVILAEKQLFVIVFPGRLQNVKPHCVHRRGP